MQTKISPALRFTNSKYFNYFDYCLFGDVVLSFSLVNPKRAQWNFCPRFVVIPSAIFAIFPASVCCHFLNRQKIEPTKRSTILWGPPPALLLSLSHTKIVFCPSGPICPVSLLRFSSEIPLPSTSPAINFRSPSCALLANVYKLDFSPEAPNQWFTGAESSYVGTFRG